jgi:hypothetical protein
VTGAAVDGGVPQQAAAYGVGRAVLDRVRAALIDVQYVCPRILASRFQGPVRATVVVAYAPVSGQRKERAAFFEQLKRTMDGVCGMEFLALLGDFNSQVGSADANNESSSWGGALRRHGVGRQNATGVELLEFAQRNRLCIAGTFFQHRPGQKLKHRNNRRWQRRGGAGGAAQEAAVGHPGPGLSGDS